MFGLTRRATAVAVLAPLLAACTDILGIADGIGYLDGGAGADVTAPGDGGPAGDGSSSDVTVAPDAPPAFDGAVDGAPPPPQLIAAFQNMPLYIAVDNSGIYWTESGAGNVRSCGLAGCQGEAARFGSGFVFPLDLAISGSTVYVTDATLDGGVYACPENRGCPSPLQPLVGVILPGAIGVDTNNVYVGTNTDIVSCPLAGCSSTFPIATSTGTEQIVPFGGALYWANPSAVFATADGGGGATVSPAQEFDVVGFAVDSQNLYFIAYPDRILACPLGACYDPNIVTLTSGQLAPTDIVLDGQGNLYWTNNGNANGDSSGSVMKLVLADDAGARVVASGQYAPEGIAVDSTYVYWTSNLPDGGVYRAPK